MPENAEKKVSSQEKISVPREEWKLVVDYYNKHTNELKLEGIRSPTMLLRRWMLDKYRESTARESTK
jgi:hypothetical protein